MTHPHEGHETLATPGESPQHHGGHHHEQHGHDHQAHGGHAGRDARQGHNGRQDHGAHQDHDAHQGHGHHAGGRVSWGMAAQATLHCLTGCAIGEILGMVIGTALGWHNGATVVLSVALAFVFGYALTMHGVRNAGLGFAGMVKVALAADTVSIIVMEIIDNSAMVFIPGAMDAGLSSGLFWLSLAGSLVLAFLVTTPVNKWLIGKGKGHAVVHGMH